MKKAVFLFTAVIFLMTFALASYAADSEIVGVWSQPILKGKDKGKERAQVEIYEKDGSYYGKIVRLPPGVPANSLCRNCKDQHRDKPLIGMEILWGLKKEAGRYVKGKVYDVDEGKEYRCSLVLMSPEKLKVTASWLIFSESHYWTRVTP